MEKIPEGIAIPDDQGNLGVCTRTALSKAIGNGFIDKDFFHKELDFDQKAITQVLVNEHKDGVGKWPTDFDGKSYHLQEIRASMWYVVNLDVAEVSPEDKEKIDKMEPSELQRWKAERMDNMDKMLKDMEKCELVLNYYYQGKIMHAVFVDSYNVRKKIVKCVNSNGLKDPYLRVPIEDILNLYKVTCTAKMAQRETDGMFSSSIFL